MGEGSKEATRLLVHKSQKRKVKDNVFEQPYEEQTKGICEDSSLFFSVVIDWAVATDCILRGSEDIKEIF